MWQTKIFRHSKSAKQTPAQAQASMDAARARMHEWLKRREGKIQFNEVFVDNCYAVEWRPLRRIG